MISTSEAPLCSSSWAAPSRMEWLLIWRMLQIELHLRCTVLLLIPQLYW